MGTAQENTVQTEGRREFTIIVNGRKREVSTDDVSYVEIVQLAYGNNPPSGPNIVITVTYRNAEDGKQGTLAPGETVEIKNGTIFDVRATDKS